MAIYGANESPAYLSIDPVRIPLSCGLLPFPLPPRASLLCLAACPSTSNIGSGVRVETAADEETKPKQTTH